MEIPAEPNSARLHRVYKDTRARTFVFSSFTFSRRVRMQLSLSLSHGIICVEHNKRVCAAKTPSFMH